MLGDSRDMTHYRRRGVCCANRFQPINVPGSVSYHDGIFNG